MRSPLAVRFPSFVLPFPSEQHFKGGGSGSLRSLGVVVLVRTAELLADRELPSVNCNSVILVLRPGADVYLLSFLNTTFEETHVLTSLFNNYHKGVLMNFVRIHDYQPHFSYYVIGS